MVAVLTNIPGMLALVNKEVARVDSRLLASSLHKSHKVLMALIHKYVDRLRGFGHLPFQKEVGAREQGGGNAQRFALLNEDQSRAAIAISGQLSGIAIALGEVIG